MPSKRKVLVCGASGFIGRNLLEQLSERDDLELYGTYFRTPSESIPKGNLGVKLERVDLTNPDEVERIVKDKDVIVQAAAVTSGSKDITTRPHIHVTDNAVMNSLLLRAAFENRVGHVVFFSCTVMYPVQEKPVREEDFDYQIQGNYFGAGWTKVYVEKMCEFYSTISDTRYTAIRHSNIYGPWDKFDLEHSHVFGATVTKVMTAKNKEIEVWGDGSESRDLLYVSDLVDFVEKIIVSQKIPFELVNLGYGSAVSVRQLVERIVRASGKDLEIKFDTTKPTIKFGLTVNTEKARARYNWAPKVSLNEGIKKTLSWYVENHPSV